MLALSNGSIGSAAVVLLTPNRRVISIPGLFDGRSILSIQNASASDLNDGWRDAASPVVERLDFFDPTLSGVRITIVSGSHVARRWQEAGVLEPGVEHRVEIIFRPGSADSARIFLREGVSGNVFCRVTASGFPAPTVVADPTSGVAGAISDIYLEPLKDGLWRMGGTYRHDAATAIECQLGFGAAALGFVDVARAGLATATMAARSMAPLEIAVADAVEDGATAWLWLDPAWPGWPGVTALEVRLNGGAPLALASVAPGAHRLTGLQRDVATLVEVRAVAADGSGAWSAAQSVTPTAASMTRFAVWADGAHSADLSAYPAVTHIGEAAASTGAINKPLALSTGEEVEYIGGDQSLWVKYYGNFAFPVADNAEIEVRHRFFEPGGRHADLAPLATRAVSFKLRAVGDGADQTATAVVLGAAGVATQPGMAAVALDGDGDPVEFRFDRVHQIGQLPDGRPFVVAPAGVVLIANGGKQTIPVNRVASWRGAQLCVVATAGLVPLAITSVTLSTAYARVLAEPDWTGWPAAAGGAGTLTIQAQPESLHLYLQSASATATEVRFRKVGATAWNPAQPLVYDDRAPNALMASVVPGNHRGVILSLEPGQPYEVQVRQGSDRYDATGNTLSLEPSKASAALGDWTDVDVTITRSGNTVTATPTTGTPVSIDATGVDYAEFTGGMVRGGAITIAATGVILRDVAVLAPTASAIIFADGASDVRLIRPRISGWARNDIGVKPASVGWGRQHDAAIELCRDHTTNHSVMVIGARCGFPRYHSNTWEHWNPSVGAPTEGYGSHPYGPNFISVKRGSYLGGVYISGCSFAGDKRRPVDDVLNGDNNKTREIGGMGPNAFMGHCYARGMADDGLEIEGSNQNVALYGNWFDLERVANRSRSPRSGVSVSTGYWGPTVLARNVFRWTQAGFVGPVGQSEQGSAFKVQRAAGSSGIPPDEQTGLVVLAHNTVFTPVIGDEPRAVFSNSASVWRNVHIYNNLGREKTIGTFALPSGTDVIVAGNNVQRQNVSPLPAMVEGTHIPTTYADVDDGVALENLNDAGPWATTITPSAGAAEVGA